MMKRPAWLPEARLPSWLPLAIAIAIPLLFLAQTSIPRNTERADTFLEALPFILGTALLLALPLVKPGRIRTIGAIALILMVLMPIWIPAAFMGIMELTADDPEGTFILRIAPEPDDHDPWTILVPVPLDDAGSPIAPAHQLAFIDTRIQLIAHNESWALQIQGTGAFQRTATFTADTKPRADVTSHQWSPTTPVLTAGTGPVTFAVAYEWNDRYCGGDLALIGGTNQTTGWATDVGDGIACT